MAHVLLPCDLPNWAELQRHFSQLRIRQTVEGLVTDMQKIHDLCGINIDPDEMPKKCDLTRFEMFRHFLLSTLEEEDKSHFFRVILPSIVTWSLRLHLHTREEPFTYSLQQEDGVTVLERRFLCSLLANAFLSTFPRRTVKTHPTLQDFAFGEFFRSLNRRVQQEKLHYILSYFEKASVKEPKGSVRFCRQVLPAKSVPSLPEWLCSSKPLCPLVVRNWGNIEDSEPQIMKVCFCSSRLGGQVLQDGDTQESMFFSKMPELLASLCFVESLQDNEALVAEGITFMHRGGQKSLSLIDSDSEVDIILMDACDFSQNPQRQYEDVFLLRELTKALAAFRNQPHSRRRPSPIGESSSSSTCPERGDSRRSSGQSEQGREGAIGRLEMAPPLAERIPPIVHHKPQTKKHPQGESNKPRQRSTTKLPPVHKPPVVGLTRRAIGRSSAEEEYFTADESADDSEGSACLSNQSSTFADNGLCLPGIGPTHERKSKGGSDYSGFVLDASDDDDHNFNPYERYEDFKRRIQRRTRRRSRRSGSRHSRLSSSGSSEMEDIVEDPELGFGGTFWATPIRSANSEPSLGSIGDSATTQFTGMLSVPTEGIHGRKLVLTTGDGQLKAYSYDGVNPNLPVPFKAEFRRRRHSSEGDAGEKTDDNFYALTNVAFWGKVAAAASSGVTSPASSEEEEEGESEESDDALLEEEQKYYKFLLPSADGLRPVATGRWGCGRLKGDAQLKTALQWLAASAAGIPCLVFYTRGDTLLKKLEEVGEIAEQKKWTVGDVACDTLRYCRNRLSILYGNDKIKASTPPFLFSLLLGESLNFSSTASASSLQ